MTIGCGVEGATALYGVGCNLRYEFCTVTCVTVGCTTLGGVAAFGTLGSETVIYILRDVSLWSILTWGDIVFNLCDGRAPSKIVANRSSVSI
jgi:hypothetical protein